MSPFSEVRHINPNLDECLSQFIMEYADGFCGEMLQTHIKTGGKRLRAKLTLQLANVFNIDLQNAFHWAMAVELLHNATLIHDDVQDGDEVRRNKPTTWVTYGVPQAINAGDLGLMLPFQCIEKIQMSDTVRWKLAQTLSKHSISAVCGQSLEMTLLPKRDFSFDSYVESALGKTGAFFGLPMEGITILAELNEEHRRCLVELYSQVGLLFQIQDDILDCFGNKGRMRGADICEGKVSILIVEHLYLYPEDEAFFIEVLERPSLEPELIQRCIDLFSEGGALNMALHELMVLEQQICNSEILELYPTQRSVLNKLLDTIMAPIHHLFDTPNEMTL